MKKYLLIALCLLVVVTLAGCGKSVSQKAAEKTAESILEESTGGKADVDIDKDTVTVNTNGGSWSAGEEVNLPAGFPEDVYVIDGKITISSSDATSGSYSVSIDTNKSVATARKEYEDKLKENGWTITLTTAFQESGSITAEKGDRTVGVYIGPGSEEGKTSVIISVTKKLS